MIHDAQVHLAGYVATDPKFKKVAGDTSSAKLRVAYTSRRRDKETGDWTDGPTSFVNVQCWRTLADNVRMSVHKGEPVLVMGRLQIRRFEDAEGAPRTAVEIEATSVGHDLTRGVAQFSRTRWHAAAAAEADALAPGSQNGAEPANDAELTGDHGEGPGPTVDGGNGVIDERAVAEFARELRSLGARGADPAADTAQETGAEADADVSTST